MIVINLKNYKFGNEALELVRKIDIYCNNAIVCVAAPDISLISKNTTLPVYAQHVDFFTPDRATGYIIPEVIKEAGASGSLLNHSEHKVSIKAIAKTIERCDLVGLRLIVCAATLRQAQIIKKFKPYGIAFEDPILVGSGKSITKYRSNDVSNFSQMLNGTNIVPLCGAGIQTKEDVKEAYRLGCKGVLISSAIANNPHPESVLKEIGSIGK